MGDRIRQLEEVVRSSCSDSHPLLAPELLSIKSALTLYGETQTGGSQNADCAPHSREHDDSRRAQFNAGDQYSSDDISEKSCIARQKVCTGLP
jgi:hypothetical protein